MKENIKHVRKTFPKRSKGDKWGHLGFNAEIIYSYVNSVDTP